MATSSEGSAPGTQLRFLGVIAWPAAALIALAVHAGLDWYAVAAVVIGIVPALLLGVSSARASSRALDRIRYVAEGLGVGDLTRRTAVTSRTEIGRAAAAIDEAAIGLGGSVRLLLDTSGRIVEQTTAFAAANAKVSAGSQDTSKHAAYVAGIAGKVSLDIATVASGAEEMSASIREISVNAHDAAKVAESGTGAAAATRETVARLGASSQEIGDVVKAVSSIAEQTNLLALNATIEAARAGEAGKGFAVVAEEVKELARETARATDEITRRVEVIQADSLGAAAAIGEISSIIASITAYQLTIASAVEEQTSTTNEMSRSVTEAAAGSERIAAMISAGAVTSDGLAGLRREMGDSVAELADLSGALATGLRGFMV